MEKKFFTRKNTSPHGKKGQNSQNPSNTGPEVKIIALSGTEGVTKNMTIYECGDDIILLDCGIGFPDAQMLGVDVVLPDFTYILENRHKVKGLLVSHGHEDHLGAIPFLLREINVPIYANKLVQGFIREKLGDKGTKDMLQNVSFHLFDPDTPEITLGNFKISAFRVNHSVPTAMGISLNTPQGRILHMADYKVDWSAILDPPIDIATISKYGEEGVMCLLSDCLGATTDGYSVSEKSLYTAFDDLFEQAEGRQLIVTTISSNISRMHQLIEVGNKYGRKVVFGGRSMRQSTGVARGLGMLPFADDIYVDEEEAQNFVQSGLLYIVAGCYGQQGSSLERISRGEHNNVVLEENAMVIFSADPNPPGVAQAVEKVIDNLTLGGAEVIYSGIQDNLHVSGHGPKGDLTMIASIVKPKYFIPIGGTISKARAYTNMVADLGFDRDSVFELLEGETVVFKDGRAKLGERIETKQVLVDGNRIGEVGAVVIKDREQLSNDGVFVVVVPVDKKTGKVTGSVDIVTRGFIYVKESQELMTKARKVANTVLNNWEGDMQNWGPVQNKLEKEIKRFLYKETRSNPMVLVHAILIS